MAETLAALGAMILLALSGWAVALWRSRRYGAVSERRRAETRRADDATEIAKRRGGALLTAEERQDRARAELDRRSRVRNGR